MAKDYSKDFQIVNIKFLAIQSGIPYSKVRNCIVGVYSSLTDHEKTRLFNTLQEEITKAASALGFTYEGRRIKSKD